MSETKTEVEETEETEVKIACVDCGETFIGDDLNATVSGLVCKDCFENYILCSICENMFHQDEITTVESEHGSGTVYYCEDCDHELNRCEECSEYLYPGEEECCDGNYYCRSCFEENFFCCDNCGEVCHVNEMVSNDDGVLCEGCAENTAQDLLTAKFFREPITYNKFPFKYPIGIESEVYPQERSSERVFGWGITSDGSLRSNGIEFYSVPFRGDQILKGLRNLEKATERFDAQVDETCGIHIHVGLNKPNSKTSPERNHRIWKIAQNVTRIWWKFEPIAFSICDNERMLSSFTYPIRKYFSYREISMAKKPSQFYSTFVGLTSLPEKYGGTHYFLGKNSRYFSLNLNSLAYRGSVEFRCYHGTTDVTEIYNWAYLVSSIVWAAEHYSAKEIEHFSGRNFQTFMRFLKIPPEIEQAFLKLIIENSDIRKKNTRTKLQEVNQYIQSTALLLRKVGSSQAKHIAKCKKIAHMVYSLDIKELETTFAMVNTKDVIGLKQMVFLKFLLRNKKYYGIFLDELRRVSSKRLAKIQRMFDNDLSLMSLTLLITEFKNMMYYSARANKPINNYGFGKKEVCKIASKLRNNTIKESLNVNIIWEILSKNYEKETKYTTYTIDEITCS